MVCPLAVVVPAAVACIILGLLASVGMLTWRAMRRRGLDRWLVPYIVQASRRRSRRGGEPVHVLLCIADHFEPRHKQASAELAMQRVQTWVERYPALFSGFRDYDGRRPQHSFFYPMEMYSEAEVNAIAGLCRQGFGEIELHLHHDNDTAETLRIRLLEYRSILAERHGMLGRHRKTGQIMYGFLHGNWSLCNSRPDGRWCGVNDELTVLRETGCYADFTMPAAPNRAQLGKINSIYYAQSSPHRPGGHRAGVAVGDGEAPGDALMLLGGPLILDWRGRAYGPVPHTENATIQRSQPPSLRRLDLWLKARIHVPARPDWLFVKLHAHGAAEMNDGGPLLAEPMARFHEALAERAKADLSFHYHYVTAREMYNLAKAAEAGLTGPVAEFRDYEIVSNMDVAGQATPSGVPLHPRVVASVGLT